MHKGLRKGYVSDLDRFLSDLERSPGASSESREQEEAKHERLARIRDDSLYQELSNEFWKSY